MKKTIVLMSVLFVWGTSIFAQITREQADNIVKEYLQNELIEYDILYVHTDEPSQEGITITTSNEEIFTAKYACWTYFVDETEFSKRRYLFIKGDDGNILEVIANNDTDFDETYWIPVETSSIVDQKENTISLIYPNPTTGQLTIENGELRMEDIEIFDVFGRNVWGNRHVSPDTTIDISHFPVGIYLLKIKTETSMIIQKVIKY
jgi:hypothetical protein